KESNVVQERTIGDFVFKCQYISAQEMVNLNGADKDAATIKAYDEHTHFKLRLENQTSPNLLKFNLSSEQEYYSRLEYFTNHIKKDISIVSEGDTIECIDVHMERSFDASPTLDLSLIFSEIDKSKPFTLIYNERVFGTGPIK